jgi:hypothetical protein
MLLDFAPVRSHVVIAPALAGVGWAIWHYDRADGHWRRSRDGSTLPVLTGEACRLAAASSWDLTMSPRPLDPSAMRREALDTYPLHGDLHIICRAGTPGRVGMWALVIWDADANRGALVEKFMSLASYLDSIKPWLTRRLAHHLWVRHDLAADQALPAAAPAGAAVDAERAATSDAEPPPSAAVEHNELEQLRALAARIKTS